MPIILVQSCDISPAPPSWATSIVDRMLLRQTRARVWIVSMLQKRDVQLNKKKVSKKKGNLKRFYLQYAPKL